MKSLVIQIRHKPIKMAFPGGLIYDKASMMFLIAEICSWFVILLQFDLDSLTKS